MKIQYKLGLLALGAIAMSSCAKHDIINDVAPVGQEVPACYWQLGSTVCKAGESFNFEGKYTTNPAVEPERSEVWYQIVRSEEAAVTAKLGGSSLNYTYKTTYTDTVRTYQSVAVFPHSAATWDGHEFIINGSVPVSRTLAPVRWVDITTWDQKNFDSFYPDTCAETFLAEVIGRLTNEETAASYYEALRTVYINYDFTNADYVAVGLPEIDEALGSADRSDKWFTTKEATPEAIVGYYYYEFVDGVNVAKELTIEEYKAITDQELLKRTFPVYDSAEWVFCRFDDGNGAIVSSVRSEWLPKFRTLLEKIPFEDWIYDTANACYKVDFVSNYSLNAQFRVYDTKGNEGKAFDIHTISIN